MKFKTFLICLSLFSSMAYSQIHPVFSINNDPVCAAFEASYIKKIASNNAISYLTNEKKVQRESNGQWAFLDPDDIANSIQFSTPLVDDDIVWLKWYPANGIKFYFNSDGSINSGIAIGSIKPAFDKSLVLNFNSPITVSIIADAELDSMLDNMQAQSKNKRERGGYALTEEGNVILSIKRQYNFRNIFEYKGSFYSVDKNGVYKLEGGQSNTVCKVGTLSNDSQEPQLTALQYVAHKRLMAIQNFYLFEMHYSFRPEMGYRMGVIVNGFKNAIEKPWLIEVDDNGNCVKGYIDYCEQNSVTDSILSKFASEDPWSYREAQAIREHVESVEYVLSQRYIKQLKLPPLVAEKIAHQAVYNFLGKVVDAYTSLSDAPNDYLKDSYTLDDAQGSIPKNWFNKTALMWAAHFNDYDAVQRLIKNAEMPESINDVTSSGDQYASLEHLHINRSALTYAAENATLPVIQALINAGADTEIKDSKGNNLDYYLEKNNLVNYTIKEIAAMSSVEIKPSFNCKLATTAQEKAICGDQGLAIYDAQMGTLYNKINKTTYSNIKVLQQHWLKELRQACSMKEQSSLSKCMKPHYRAHIKYLNNLLTVQTFSEIEDSWGNIAID